MAFGLLSLRTATKPAPVKERLHVVAGRSLPLRIVENGRARRLTLRIDSGGRGLRVTVPPGVAWREVDRFLNRHQDWLEQRLAKVPIRPNVRPGIKLPLRGVPHRIVHEPGTRGTVTVSKKTGEPVLIVHGERQHLSRRLSDFLKRQAKRDIEALVEKHTTTIRKRAKAIRFRDTVEPLGFLHLGRQRCPFPGAS